MQIKEKIKDIRLKAGLTQKQLAEKIGTTASYISQIENGRFNISFDKLEKIAEACGFKAEIIFKK